MATRVRCLKCLKIIECSPYDTQILLDHIRTNHPEIELPDDEMEKEGEYSNKTPPRGSQSRSGSKQGDELYELQPGGDMQEETIRNVGRRPMYTRKYKVHNPRVAQSPQKRRLYKTSIEKWRPAQGTIYCPKCGSNKRPLIRSRSEKMSYSSVGAACILTCWPLCFLPCLFPSPTKEYLHCAECNNFLGMYDKQSNCVRPNRDFVEDSRSPGRLSRASVGPGEGPVEGPGEEPRERPGEGLGEGPGVGLGEGPGVGPGVGPGEGTAKPTFLELKVEPKEGSPLEKKETGTDAVPQDAIPEKPKRQSLLVQFRKSLDETAAQRKSEAKG